METPSFELPNVAVGPDPLSLSTLRSEVDFVVVLLLRDYRCPKCKQQVQRVAERAPELRDRNAAPVAILPDSRDRAADWQAEFDLPFPLLADPSKQMGEEYDQPRRFGALGKVHDLLGRMPKTLVLDLRENEAEVLYVHEGASAGDRADPDELLAVVDDVQTEFAFDCSLVEC